MSAAKCVVPEYVVGSNSENLAFLFNDVQITRLEEHSPVVFFGPDGSGKTSLAVTLAVRWSRLTAAKPIMLTSGAQFAAEYQEALEADDVEHFRRRHRRCKLLVIDDVDTLESKPAAQDELCTTLDSMSDNARPVIVTLQRLPASCRGLRGSLVSRLSGGLSIALAAPDSEVQIAILKRLIAASDTLLDIDLFLPLLNKAAQPFTVEQLQQLVLFAVHQRRLLGRLEPNSLRDFAAGIAAHEPPDLSTIAKAASKRFQVKLPELRGSTRAAKVVRARGLAIVLARRLTPASLQQIGEYFGGRDHSTILHSLRKIEDNLHLDAELAVALHELQQELSSGSAAKSDK